MRSVPTLVHRCTCCTACLVYANARDGGCVRPPIVTESLFNACSSRNETRTGRWIEAIGRSRRKLKTCCALYRNSAWSRAHLEPLLRSDGKWKECGGKGEGREK